MVALHTHMESKITRRNMDQYIGPYQVGKEAVFKVKTPAPAGMHMPIAHDLLYETIRDELDASGVSIQEDYHALYGQGARYIGLALTDIPSSRGRENVVGWFNSHDKSRAVTLLFGERVMVCFNLVFAAEVMLSRKHTLHVARDLPYLVGQGVTQLRTAQVIQAQRTDAYDSCPLPPQIGHDLVIRLLDAGAFPASRIPAILKEWREPSFPEHAEAWNLMRLHNAITYQTQPFRTLPRRHARLHSCMDDYARFRPRLESDSSPLRLAR